MERLADRYELGPALGQGRSTVFRATDLRLRRQVAIKRVALLAGSEEVDQVRTRALREAQASARLNNPSAVTVYDVVEEGGAIWLVMELVDGPSLARVIEEGGPLTHQQAAGIGLSVLTALEAAHLVGVVHRDVKPANVLVPPGNRAKLTDFGVATIRDESRVTATGLIVGSPSYMAPEQATGGEITAATDLWALGALLYFAVEGVPPYQEATALATATAVVHAAPRPQQRPGPLGALLGRLLVKDPAARASAGEVRVVLTSVARGDRRPRVAESGEHVPSRRTAVAPVALEALDAPTAVAAAPPSAAAAVPETSDAQADPPPVEGVDSGPAPDEIANPVPAEAAGDQETVPADALGASETTGVASDSDAGSDAAGSTPADGAAAAEVASPVSAGTVARTPGGLRRRRTAPPGRRKRRPAVPTGSPLDAVASTAAASVGTALTRRAGRDAAVAPPVAPDRAEDRTVAPAPTTRSPTVLLFLGFLLLAVAAVIAVPALTAGDGDDGTSQDAASSEPDDDGTAADNGDAADDGAEDTPAPTSTAPSTTNAGAELPDGWIPYHDPEGAYTIGLPPGWRVEGTGNENRIDLVDPATGSFLRIEWTGSPGDDPAQAWRELAATFGSRNANYRQLGIGAVDYRDYNAALWEFTHGSGQTLHTGNLGFVTAGRGYALMLRTPEDLWDSSQDLFDQFKQAFEPT